MNTSLKRSWLVAPAVAIGVLLGGCDRLDTSKPDAEDVQSIVQQLYGACPLWSVSGVQKGDGVPIQGQEIPMYAGQVSFTVSLKIASDKAKNAALEQNAAACVYPLTAGLLDQIHPSRNQQYKISLQLLFARTDHGWNGLAPTLDNYAVINLYNHFGISMVGQAAPLTSTDGSATDQDSTAHDATNPSIFHRLNQIVLSLFKGNSSSWSTQNARESAAAPPAASAAQANSPAVAGAIAPSAEPAGAAISDAAASQPAQSNPAVPEDSDASSSSPIPKFRDYPSETCETVLKNIKESDETPYELSMGTYIVTGAGRLQFLYAPDVRCTMPGVFVVPGDELNPDADYKEFTHVQYVNPKTMRNVEGWVETGRLKKSGHRAYLQ